MARAVSKMMLRVAIGARGHEGILKILGEFFCLKASKFFFDAACRRFLSIWEVLLLEELLPTDMYERVTVTAITTSVKVLIVTGTGCRCTKGWYLQLSSLGPEA